MSLEVYKYRKGLSKLQKAIEDGVVTIGFIGGSITDSDSGLRWPEYVIGWFSNNYPAVRFYIENAAIGATGSDLAVFRAERDLISRGCDIVFIEFAVNDNNETKEKRMRSREGLIRKLLREERDVVLVYTYCQEMYESIINNEVPDSIKEFEELAEYYSISSVWMGLNAFKEVRQGMMKWEEWLPDGLHPEYRGSYCYAQSVIAYLQKELMEKKSEDYVSFGCELSLPYNENNWERTNFIDFSEVELQGVWSVRRARSHNMMDRILYTASPGAKLSFKFKGRGLALAFDFGKTSAEYKYRLDEESWIETNRERDFWMNDSGCFRLENLYDDLDNVEHKFELEVIHGNREVCKGTNFRLVFIGVIQ